MTLKNKELGKIKTYFRTSTCSEVAAWSNLPDRLRWLPGSSSFLSCLLHKVCVWWHCRYIFSKYSMDVCILSLFLFWLCLSLICSLIFMYGEDHSISILRILFTFDDLIDFSPLSKNVLCVFFQVSCRSDKWEYFYSFQWECQAKFFRIYFTCNETYNVIFVV